MIVGGTIASNFSKKARTYLQMVQNVQLTGFVPKMARINNPVIGFTKENARRLYHPHNDALEIIIWVAEMPSIFLCEHNYKVVDPCHLWDEAQQLDVLNHP